MKTAEQWIEEWVEEWAKDTDVTLREIIEQAQKEAYNEAWEHAIALRKRIGNPYNEREGKTMLDFEIEARKLKK